MARKDIVVGIDLGSTKTCAVIGTWGQMDDLHIIGVGMVPSTGMRKGIVVDIERASRAVTEAVQQAESMAGVEVSVAYVGISGSHVTSRKNRGVVAVSNTEHEIGPEDIERVMHNARVLSLPSESKLLHVLPRQFIVDGYDGIRDPVGMSGVRLEVETLIVTAAGTAIQNVQKSVARAGIEIEELVLQPLASAEAVLTPAEKDLGSILLDIGGGITEMAVYDQGGLWYTSVFPYGGEHVTNDLAVGLRITGPQAEEIKLSHGNAFNSDASRDHTIEIPSMNNKDVLTVSQHEITQIIEPRLQDIFEWVRGEIEKSGCSELVPGGLILTGGTAQLKGIADLAERELSMPVRIGSATNINGMSDAVAGPVFATAVGLLRYGAARQKALVGTRSERGYFSGLIERVGDWLRDLL